MRPVPFDSWGRGFQVGSENLVGHPRAGSPPWGRSTAQLALPHFAAASSSRQQPAGRPTGGVGHEPGERNLGSDSPEEGRARGVVRTGPWLRSGLMWPLNRILLTWVRPWARTQVISSCARSGQPRTSPRRWVCTHWREGSRILLVQISVQIWLVWHFFSSKITPWAPLTLYSCLLWT